MKKNRELALVEPVENKILLIREHRVILDIHLAALYGVSTKALNQAIKRNIERFPSDFLFQLNFKEAADAKARYSFQEKGMNIKYRPYAFTEHGVVMAANVLRTKRAIQASIFVVRAFVKLKQFTSSYRELALKLDELERTMATHDKAICSLFEAIRKLMAYPDKPHPKIGFDLGTSKKE